MIIKTQQRLNQTNNINFQAYRGADFYGVPENKDALNYKIKLTPQKIDEIIKNAPNTDEGIFNVYKELSKEGQQVKNAFSGFNVIFRQYMYVAKDRMEEIMNMNPKGSKIPVVGIVSKGAAKITGRFEKRIIKEVGNLNQDFDEIIHKYFHNGINKIITDYMNVNKYFYEGIEYINTIKGESDSRVKLSEYLKNNNSSCFKSYSNLYENLVKSANIINENSAKLIKKQKSKQTRSLLVSGIMKLGTGGSG